MPGTLVGKDWLSYCMGWTARYRLEGSAEESLIQLEVNGETGNIRR